MTLNKHTQEKKRERKRRKEEDITSHNHGTKGYFKHVANLTPGFEKGDKTNLQDGGKPYKGYDIKSFINKNKKK